MVAACNARLPSQVRVLINCPASQGAIGDIYSERLHWLCGGWGRARGALLGSCTRPRAAARQPAAWCRPGPPAASAAPTRMHPPLL